ncbi:hypothetical protein [Armatimonas sp.]|uniref:hypothetical protein n=1 Tax=Armatimonas sp. TaxID=1872638 RepID=UPI00286C205C|nr:hypothetical protein [Armatimonas sp.]
MTTRCEVRVLGQLAVTFADGHEPVTKFRTKKSAQLLAYLALHAGKAHAREFLQASIQERLGDGRFRSLWQQGSALSMTEAVALALA